MRQSARDYFTGLKKCRRINNKTELKKKNERSKTKVISIKRSKIVISRWTAKGKMFVSELIWFSWWYREKRQNDLFYIRLWQRGQNESTTCSDPHNFRLSSIVRWNYRKLSIISRPPPPTHTHTHTHRLYTPPPLEYKPAALACIEMNSTYCDV